MTAVGEFPGALTIQILRSAPGAGQPAPVTVRADDMTSLTAQLKPRSQILLPAPPNMGPRNNVVVERLTAVVTWDPDAADPCAMQEQLQIRWEYATPRGPFNVAFASTQLQAKRKTTVTIGQSATRETFPDGRVELTVPVQTLTRAHRCSNT